MPTLASAYVQIVPSAEGISGSLQKALDPEAEKAGASAGKAAGGKFTSALGTVAKAGAGAAAAVVGAGIAAGAWITKGVSDLATYGDNIDKVSQKMGISREGFQEWDFILQHNGSSMESLRASMKTLANAAETDSDAFKELGISQEQIANSSNEELFNSTIAALQGVENETKRTYLAGKLLGRGATELGPLLNMTAEETEEMRKQVRDLGGVMSDDAVKASARYQDSLQDMKTSIDGVKRSMLSQFLPAAADVMDGITGIVTGASDGVEKLQGGVESFAGKLLEQVPKIISVAKPIVAGLASAIITNLPKLLNTGIELIKSLGSAIVGAVPMIATAAVQIVQTLGNFIVTTDWIGLGMNVVRAIGSAIQTAAASIFGEDGGGGLFDSIKDAFVNVDWAGAADMALGFLSDALAWGVEVIPQVLETIGLTAINFFQSIDWAGVGQAVINFISNGIQTLAANIPTLMSNIGKTAVTLFKAINWIQLGKTVITLIKSGLSALFTAIPTLLKSIGQGALNLFKSINWAAVGRAVINLIKSGIRALFTAIPTALKSIGTSAMSGFKSINWASVGWAVINGIKNGISSLAGSLIESVKSLGARALSGIKGILGIASPSKVFADEVGANMALGIKQGWEKNLPVDDMVADTKRMTDDLSAASTFTASGAVTGASSGDKLGAILQILAYYFPELVNRDITLDSDKLIGALTPGINRKLGMIAGW